jgi:4-diphosphocytidyl-2-C-methyl-D-erythritol kinase
VSRDGTVLALAPAKVNLWLDVLGKRADGFHEVDTGLLALDLADEVRVVRSEAPGVRVELSGPQLTDDVPADGTNLAARAAASVLERAVELGRVAPETGLRVHVEKNVPSGAGLGGGSADAAAALLATARLLEVEVEAERSREWLAALGSDCVFFLDAAETGLARCLGRGERVLPLACPDRGWTLALLSPDVACPTARVYAALGRSLSGAPVSSSVRETLLSRPEIEARNGIGNDLEGPALDAVPALRTWRGLLDENGARHYRLSGSGSTFFGLFRESREARGSLERLVRAAAECGFRPRGHWLAHPSGAGARLVPDP